MCCLGLAANTGRKKVAKNRHLGTIAQLHRVISSQLRHILTIGKKNLLSSNTSSTCPYNMVNFGLLAAEIVSLVQGTPANFNGFRVLAALLYGIQQWASAKLCGVEQRVPPMFGRATFMLGIGPHFQLELLCTSQKVNFNTSAFQKVAKSSTSDNTRRSNYACICSAFCVNGSLPLPRSYNTWTRYRCRQPYLLRCALHLQIIAVLLRYRHSIQA